MLVSVVVNNYNYARFLGEAIDSALAQTHPDLEVIVVDDGSTDESREVIAGYGARVTAVLKRNGGQTSALNAGFAASRGGAVCFLDADDALYPTAMERAVEALDPGTAKIHWQLVMVDGDGEPLGELSPGRELGDGDLRDAAIREGPESYASVPTSGHLWARWFLQEVLPLPEVEARERLGSAHADSYLSDLAPLFGPVRGLADPQGLYRVHGANDYVSLPFEDKLARDVWSFDARCDALARFCRARGIEVDADAWKRGSWLRRYALARAELDATLPAGAPVVLVDEPTVGVELAAGRPVVPFLERDGHYWGAPADDATAVAELSRMRDLGGRFLVFAWPSFWWLDHYAGFRSHLRSEFVRILENDQLVVYDLGDTPVAAGPEPAR